MHVKILCSVILLSILSIAVLRLPARVQQNEQLATLADTNAMSKSVNVETVSKILIGKNSSAFLISYRYDFGNLPAVHIGGIGTVAPRGNYRYISQSQELEFRDSSGGKVLAQVPLVETTVVADTPPLNEIPDENQFSIGYREFTWDLRTPLQERANAVLGQYFNYLPREHGNIIYLATTYTPLALEQKLSKSKTALIALLLSFPFDPSTDKYSFRIQSSVREGRPLSDDIRPTKDPDILNSAKLFVDNLVTQMKGRGEVM